MQQTATVVQADLLYLFLNLDSAVLCILLVSFTFSWCSLFTCFLDAAGTLASAVHSISLASFYLQFVCIIYLCFRDAAENACTYYYTRVLHLHLAFIVHICFLDPKKNIYTGAFHLHLLFICLLFLTLQAFSSLRLFSHTLQEQQE